MKKIFSFLLMSASGTLLFAQDEASPLASLDLEPAGLTIIPTSVVGSNNTVSKDGLQAYCMPSNFTVIKENLWIATSLARTNTPIDYVLITTEEYSVFCKARSFFTTKGKDTTFAFVVRARMLFTHLSSYVFTVTAGGVFIDGDSIESIMLIREEGDPNPYVARQDTLYKTDISWHKASSSVHLLFDSINNLPADAPLSQQKRILVAYNDALRVCFQDNLQYHEIMLRDYRQRVRKGFREENKDYENALIDHINDMRAALAYLSTFGYGTGSQ